MSKIRKQMKIFFVTLITLLYCVEFTYSQSEGQIKEVIDKGGYDYIPPAYLTDSTLGIIHSYRLFQKDSDKKSFEIFWNSFCTDGRYYLTITPEQIYLTDGHENPNPSQLYWILTIDWLVYQQILTGFQKEQKRYYYFDESYDEGKLIDENYTNCELLLEKQIDKFFAKINKFIKNDGQKLDKTKRIIPQTGIYYGYSRKEIEDWSTSMITHNNE